MSYITHEVVLPRRVSPQPTPDLSRGGDCGACVFSGLLGLSGPAEVYEKFTDKGELESIHHHLMVAMLVKAEREGLIDRMITDFPTWPVYPQIAVFGAPSWCQGLEWYNYVRMALDAGYYGLARVDMHKKGAYGEGSNHWVLLCGVREIHPETEGRVLQEVLVSNSSRSAPPEEWVEHSDFLRYWGGFNLFLARPVDRGKHS